MSTRLQVLLPENELKEIQRAAKRRKLTVAEWVRQVLREARRQDPSRNAGRKLEAIRAAYGNDFPTADIGQVLADIEAGYGSGPG